MKLIKLFEAMNDLKSMRSAPEPVDGVEETLLQLAYDQVDGKEAFACMYVVAGEVINALHRMASYNPLFVERLNQSLLRCADRAKAETPRKS